MRSAIAFLSVCIFLCHSVNAGDDDDCMKQIKEVKQTMNKMIEDDTVPECAKENEMTQFKCTAGEDPEKDKEVAGKFKKWFEGLDDDKKKVVMECAEEVISAVEEKMGGALSDECKEKMNEMEKKMMGKEK